MVKEMNIDKKDPYNILNPKMENSYPVKEFRAAASLKQRIKGFISKCPNLVGFVVVTAFLAADFFLCWYLVGFFPAIDGVQSMAMVISFMFLLPFGVVLTGYCLYCFTSVCEAVGKVINGNWID